WRSLPDNGTDARLGARSDRLPDRVPGWPARHHALAQWTGQRFHVRGSVAGNGRALIDPLLPAAQPKRGLLSCLDVESREDVSDGQGAVPGGADALDDGGTGRGDALVGDRPAPPGNAASCGPLRGAASLRLLAQLMERRAALS